VRGASFALEHHDHSSIPPPRALADPLADPLADQRDSDILVVSIATSDEREHVTQAQGRVLSVAGAGRHRLPSLLAAALEYPGGFVFLKSHDKHFDDAGVRKVIRKNGLEASYGFIAFRHRRFPAASDWKSDLHAPFVGDFGTISDGILLSRAAAELIVLAANDISFAQRVRVPPDPCSEFEVFSDVWLSWCALSLDIPALDITFATPLSRHEPACSECHIAAALGAQFDLLQLIPPSYDESQPHNLAAHSAFDFPGERSQRFKRLIQNIAVELSAARRNSDGLGGVQSFKLQFWNDCCSAWAADLMTQQSPVHPDAANVHPDAANGTGTQCSFSAAEREANAINIATSLPPPALDNEHLQLVSSARQTVMKFDRSVHVAASFAWIVTGVWRGERSVTTLRLLRDKVCAGVGVGHVHFYFIVANAEEGSKEAMTSDRRRDIRSLINETLPPGSVMLVHFQETLDHSGWYGRAPASARFCSFACSDTWCSRLQAAYNYITGTETAQFYRYAFVVHSRTDTRYGGPLAPAQKWHDMIPTGGIAGSNWKLGRDDWQGGKDDSFFVMRRAHAAAALLYFPAFTYRFIRRDVLSDNMQHQTVWRHKHCWPEVAIAHFFTASTWSEQSMMVLDLCGLGLVGTLDTDMNCRLKPICP
jgi:hypothetical protein